MALRALPDPGVMRGTSAFYEIHKHTGAFEFVSFSNVLTKSIEVKPLMESFSTDQIGTSVEISFTALASYHVNDNGASRTGLHLFGTPEFGSLTDGDDISTKVTGGAVAGTRSGLLEGILRVLANNRGRFVYKIGNSVLYDVAPVMSHAGSRRDGFDPTANPNVGMAVNQTPVVEASVNKVIGDGSVYMNVKVKFDYIRCTGEIGADERFINNVKSLRWYYADDIDTDTWLTRRVFRGRLEVLDRHVNVQTLRYLVLPPVQLGFRRTSINLQEAEDGMSLDFEVVDQEIIAAAPYPLSSWEGNTSLNFPRLLIGKADISSNIRVQAPKWVRKIAVAAWAMRIIDAKIHWYNSVSYGESVFTDKFTMSDTFSDNSIDISVKLSFVLPELKESQGRVFNNPIWRSIDATFNNNLTYDEGRRLAHGSVPTGSQDGWEYDEDWNYREGAGPGHARGIEFYNPNYSPYWYPSNHTLAGIFRCALQHPCSSTLQKPQEWFVNFPSDQEGGPKEPPNQGGDQQGGGDRQDPTNGDDDMELSRPKDGQSTNTPYTQYEIQTVMSTDMGIKTFSPMNNIRTLGGFDASRIVHQSNAPTETVTMILDAKRLNRWPNGPNELSFQDPQTKIYYICESVDTIASTAVQDALRSTVEYSLKAVVKYRLSRHHKHFEDKLVFTPPFIEEASAQDSNVGNALRGYYQSTYNKSGLRFRPRGDEDNGATEPPPSDGGGGDTPLPLY